MKSIYDKLSFDFSTTLTKRYSTSFSLAILLMPRALRESIYGIYGFVRIADEIVDSFHDFNQKELLQEFREETYRSIDRKISTNPIMHSFQDVVNRYNIDIELVDAFLNSMEMDLEKQSYDDALYKQYIYGSAEVVGLMCLKVFLKGDSKSYEELKPYARHLGSAFQKINFLRDLKYDYKNLDRLYFPEFDVNDLSKDNFQKIYQDIQQDFDQGMIGIRKLPKPSRGAVYIAYKYYIRLFKKIKNMNALKAFENRIRISNFLKIRILFSSYIRHKLNFI